LAPAPPGASNVSIRVARLDHNGLTDLFKNRSGTVPRSLT
jgi:hypothetical protein